MVVPDVVEQVKSFASHAEWHLYPAGVEHIASQLAAMWDIDPECVRLSSGASSALRDFVTSFLLQGGSVAFPGGTFPGYVGHLPETVRRRHAPNLHDYGHDPQGAELHAWLEDDSLAAPRLCVIPYPASPIPGAEAELAWLEGVLEEHTGVHYLIDTVYCPWASLKRVFDVIGASAGAATCSVLVSASKTLGLAGLRLGATVVGPATLREVGLGALPFPVSSVQLIAWQALIESLRDLPSRQSEEAIRLHEEIRGELRRLDVPVLAEEVGLYVAVPLDQETRVVHLRAKRMPGAGVLRIRVDHENRERLAAASP